MKEKDREDKIYGLNSALAAFKHRQDDLAKIYLLPELQPRFKDLLNYARSQRIAYKLVEAKELEKITGALHHQGICLIFKSKAAPDAQTVFSAVGPGQMVMVEEVGNPHNLGGILRTAAHFGAKALVVVKTEGGPPLSTGGAMTRVAEGGAEVVPVLYLSFKETQILAKKYGWQIVATTPHNGVNLFEVKLPERTIFLLGAEGPGLSNASLKMAAMLVQIPGTDEVESLNVSVAAGLFMGRWAQLWS